MTQKQVKQIFNHAHHHMVGDGFRVANYIPGPNSFSHETSPFYMLDYNEPYNFPPANKKRGVDVHPHRGFETVTVVYEGELEHKDSSGGGGTIGAGDVQWMTAASGVLHEEFQTESFSKNGGIQHMMQIWVNLPAKYKMSNPKYQSITNKDIAQYAIDTNGSTARVIAGDFKGVKGAATTFTPVEMYDIRLVKGAEVTVDLPAAYNTMLLVTKGGVTINGNEKASFKDFVLFKHEGETIHLKAEEDSMIFVMSGEPIKEPIAAYGPFVMNTKEEIVQAIDDYNAGRFGKINKEN